MSEELHRFGTAPERIAMFKRIRDSYRGLSVAEQEQCTLAILQECRETSLPGPTTYELMRHADIYDPRPRIHALRAKGHRIVTMRTTVVTESGAKHLIGRYVLLREGMPA